MSYDRTKFGESLSFASARESIAPRFETSLEGNDLETVARLLESIDRSAKESLDALNKIARAVDRDPTLEFEG